MTNFRYEFGDANQYWYEFNVLSLVVNPEVTHHTITISGMNVGQISTDIIDPYLPGLISFLAKLSLEYNTYFDSFHNYFFPYTYEQSASIVDQVNAAAGELKSK
jgi:hypothetical protein